MADCVCPFPRTTCPDCRSACLGCLSALITARYQERQAPWRAGWQLYGRMLAGRRYPEVSMFPENVFETKDGDMSMHEYLGRGIPWADFLNARARVLEEWRREGKTPEQMVASMGMDPGQVRLILMTVADHPDEYPVPARAPRRGTR